MAYLQEHWFFLALVLVAYFAGMGVGASNVRDLVRAKQNGWEDFVLAELRALRLTHGLSAEAWRTQQALHDQARRQDSPG